MNQGLGNLKGRDLMENEIRRMPAIKTDIKNINAGKFSKGVKEFDPNYVVTENKRKISRARISGVVIDKNISEDGRYGTLTIDDGEDSIRLRVFDSTSLIENIELGTFIDAIGKVKEYNGEKYIIPENIHALEEKFKELRKLEIKKDKEDWERIKKIISEKKSECADIEELKKIMKNEFGIDEYEVDSVLVTDEPSQEKSKDDIVLEIIDNSNDVDGCEYSTIIEKSGLPEEEIEPIINRFLEHGICFEPKPGKLKRL